MTDSRKPELHAPHPETKEWRRWEIGPWAFVHPGDIYLDAETLPRRAGCKSEYRVWLLRDLGPLEAVNAELLAVAQEILDDIEADLTLETEARLCAAIARAEAGEAKPTPELHAPNAELLGQLVAALKVAYYDTDIHKRGGDVERKVRLAIVKGQEAQEKENEIRAFVAAARAESEASK